MNATWLKMAVVAACLCGAGPAWGQQRPLVTEDPEPVGAGRLLVEGGVDYERGYFEPLSGLTGTLLTVPTLGFSVGLSSIAELQVDGAPYSRLTITDRQPAPFSSILVIDGAQTTSVRDIVVATKIRLLGEAGGRPALGLRFSTRLPNASNESGLGRDTIDFGASFLFGKTIQSIRVVGNVGLLLMQDPTEAARQDDMLGYGLSLARAISPGAEVVGEINGRANFEASSAAPGMEDRAMLRAGLRYTRGSVRVDGGVLIGLSPRDPVLGFTAGFTWVVDAFRVP